MLPTENTTSVNLRCRKWLSSELKLYLLEVLQIIAEFSLPRSVTTIGIIILVPKLTDQFDGDALSPSTPGRTSSPITTIVMPSAPNHIRVKNISWPFIHNACCTRQFTRSIVSWCFNLCLIFTYFRFASVCMTECLDNIQGIWSNMQLIIFYDVLTWTTNISTYHNVLIKQFSEIVV